MNGDSLLAPGECKLGSIDGDIEDGGFRRKFILLLCGDNGAVGEVGGGMVLFFDLL